MDHSTNNSLRSETRPGATVDRNEGAEGEGGGLGGGEGVRLGVGVGGWGGGVRGGDWELELEGRWSGSEWKRIVRQIK